MSIPGLSVQGFFVLNKYLNGHGWTPINKDEIRKEQAGSSNDDVAQVVTSIH